MKCLIIITSQFWTDYHTYSRFLLDFEKKGFDNPRTKIFQDTKAMNSQLPLHLKQTFPPMIWILNEGEGDGIESRLPFKIFSTLLTIICIAVAKFARKRIPILKLNTSLKSCTIRLVETWSWDDCFVVYCKTNCRKVFFQNQEMVIMLRQLFWPTVRKKWFK